MNLRRIARHLGLHHRTVSLCIQTQTGQLPDLLVPSEVKEAEMDALFTSIGDKKPNPHDYHRQSGHSLLFGLQSGLAANARGDPGNDEDAFVMPMIACGATGELMKSPRAKPTPTRSKVIMPSCAIIWLAWPAARAVSRVIRKLMFYFNCRQLHKQRFPNYPAHVFQFIQPKL
ncbi:MAG: hypothetical protein IT308_04360 [Anaerolineaceae bacterium]|nr:hypothetical protein [Anaerolineaceae bacterium]